MTALIPMASSLISALIIDSRSAWSSRPSLPIHSRIPEAKLERIPRRPPNPSQVILRTAWWLAAERAMRPLVELFNKVLGRHAAESLPRWRMFWKIAVQRLGLRGATAAGLIAMDGPLPVGDAVALGLTVWMIYDLIAMTDQIWDLVDEAIPS